MAVVVSMRNNSALQLGHLIVTHRFLCVEYPSAFTCTGACSFACGTLIICHLNLFDHTVVLDHDLPVQIHIQTHTMCICMWISFCLSASHELS